MFYIGNLTSSTVIILSLKSKMIPYFFMVLTPMTPIKNKVILWLINLVLLNNIRCQKVPFAIGIFKEIQF
jgi:hypothetical protein